MTSWHVLAGVCERGIVLAVSCSRQIPSYNMWMWDKIWTPAVWVYCIALIGGAAGTQHHARLIKQLLVDSGYDTSVRPVLSVGTTTDVSLYINLHQIRDMSEKEQVLTTLVWITFRWRDEFLMWNATDHDNIQNVHIQSSRIWTPDIILHNSVDNSRSASNLYADTNAIVNHDGSVFWTTSALVMSSCKVDIASYPFDNQSCVFYFGSWTYDMYNINLTCSMDGVATENFVVNGEWHLVDSSCRRFKKKYPCCDHPYSDVIFTINMTRRPMFYLYNLLFPAVCLLIVGTLAFWIPPESGEKISLSVTVLLAMTVFMLIIMDNIPATSEVIPWLEKFTGLATGILSLSTIMGIVVVNVHYHGNLGVPPRPWIKRYFLDAGLCRKLLFMKEVHPQDRGQADTVANNRSQMHKTSRESPRGDVEKYSNSTSESRFNEIPESHGNVYGEFSELRPMSSNEEKESLEKQWRDIALVINRICLICHLILVLVILIYVFFSL